MGSTKNNFMSYWEILLLYPVPVYVIALCERDALKLNQLLGGTFVAKRVIPYMLI